MAFVAFTSLGGFLVFPSYTVTALVAWGRAGRAAPGGSRGDGDRMEVRAKPLREDHQEEDQEGGIEERGDKNSHQGANESPLVEEYLA